MGYQDHHHLDPVLEAALDNEAARLAAIEDPVLAGWEVTEFFNGLEQALERVAEPRHLAIVWLYEDLGSYQKVADATGLSKTRVRCPGTGSTPSRAVTSHSAACRGLVRSRLRVWLFWPATPDRTGSSGPSSVGRGGVGWGFEGARTRCRGAGVAGGRDAGGGAVLVDTSKAPIAADPVVPGYPSSIRISMLSGRFSKTVRSEVTSPIFVRVGTELVSS